MAYLTRYLDSPIGTLVLRADDSALREVLFVDAPEAVADASPILDAACAQLTAYFAGELMQFDLPLGGEGTEFQRSVWGALTTIPYGETCSYADIAHQIDNPKSVRAVGMANGKNPLSIVVPCHRVIGSSGKLTGYAGGLSRKEWLLAHEAAHSDYRLV